MESLDESKEKVLELAKNDKVRFVDLQFTDLFGTVKSVTIGMEHLGESLEKGTWFDGSSIEGFMRIAESDMYLMPDPETYALIPWKVSERPTARMICDVYNSDSKPFEGDPRYILKRALAEAKKEGLTYNTGPELEFFLFKRDNGAIRALPHDSGGYFDLSMDQAYEVRRDMVLALEKFGILVEMSHHEVAAGQHEIDFRYGNALRTADNAVTLKFTFKAIAQKHDLYATFMPKPIFGINGSGMHVHQSLFDSKGRNVFFDEKDKYKLSKLAYGFIAGQLKHVRGISALLAPTVNSYKRLVPGYEAPVYICWGQRNRSALIRVPKYSEGRQQSTRAELRCPDPSCNPYLAFASMLRAGLDGIRSSLAPPDPVEEDVYKFDDSKLKKFYITTLPGSLREALGEFENSKIVQETLGPHAFENYLRNKKAEWDAFRIAVTDWEISEYLGNL
ncbi:MAG: type I glutamate--ammonia ligase [Candidatus Altiarchaeota archaeon]|nr:type I glutamate--ammonia ligase [Candidatus Altiarchaeota archaeon]